MQVLNILFSAITFLFVSAKYIPMGEIVFNFSKPTNGSDVYAFEYKNEDGEMFRGKILSLNYSGFHLVRDADEKLFWMEIFPEDFKASSVSRIAKPVERDGNKLIFRDDEVDEYSIDILEGFFLNGCYDGKWNAENVCFTKSKDKANTFNFVIKSLNNPRKYDGSTNYEGSPLTQVILIRDIQHDFRYEVNFTQSELDSTGTFCKGVTEMPQELDDGIQLGVDILDPVLLRALVGYKTTR